MATEYPRVVAAVALMCGDRGLAEDAVQESLARACDEEERGVRIERLGAWVTTAAMNRSRTALRSRARERRALGRIAAGAGPERDGARLDPSEALAVRRGVAALPRRQRQAVVLRYFMGFDVAEVAEALGVAEGTAKALLYQARHRLGELLADEGVRS